MYLHKLRTRLDQLSAKILKLHHLTFLIAPWQQRCGTLFQVFRDWQPGRDACSGTVDLFDPLALVESSGLRQTVQHVAGSFLH